MQIPVSVALVALVVLVQQKQVQAQALDRKPVVVNENIPSTDAVPKR
ncbi:9736_t:CDS:2, partial [Diversispora eburnea]